MMESLDPFPIPILNLPPHLRHMPQINDFLYDVLTAG